MADPPLSADPNADAGDETRVEPGRPATPGWVKAFAVAGLALIILVAVLLVIGGEHGPGRHVPAGVPATPAMPASS
jgi:hypothetical protein